MASLPIKVVVEGSPLSLKREALGLDLSGPEPLLSFGEVFVHGGKTFRVIKVCVCMCARQPRTTLHALVLNSLRDNPEFEQFVAVTEARRMRKQRGSRGRQAADAHAVILGSFGC